MDKIDRTQEKTTRKKMLGTGWGQNCKKCPQNLRLYKAYSI